MGEMSWNISSRPSLRNHSYERRWISIRSGRSSTSGILLKERRSRRFARIATSKPLTSSDKIWRASQHKEARLSRSFSCGQERDLSTSLRYPAGNRETMRQYIGSSGATKTIPPVSDDVRAQGTVRPIIKLGTLRFYHGARVVSTHKCAPVNAKVGSQETGRPRAGRSAARPWPRRPLLDLDGRAGLFQLLLDLLGLLLGDAFLDRLGSAVHQVLGLLEAQPGQLPDHLDHLNLLVASRLQDDVKLRLLLGLGGCRRGGARHCRGHGHGRGRRDAELLLQRLDQLGQLQHRHLLDGFQNLLLGHRSILLTQVPQPTSTPRRAGPSPSGSLRAARARRQPPGA